MPPPTGMWMLIASCAQSLSPPMFHLNSQSPGVKTWFLFSDAN